MALPNGQISISQISTEFSCPNDLNSCRNAAGLPSGTVSFGDFKGLSSAPPASASISPVNGFTNVPAGSYAYLTFSVQLNDAVATSYTWSITGAADIYTGQGTASLRIREHRNYGVELDGTVKCIINYSGGSITITTNYYMVFFDGGGNPLN